MAEYPLFPLWTDAYLGDTSHLSTIEHGAYLLLLITMWRNGGWLPNDDKMLARYARLNSQQWRRIKPVLWNFFDEENQRLTQGRLTAEWVAVKQRSKSASRSAQARWLKNNETSHATASETQCESDATRTRTRPNKEKIDKKKKRGGRIPDGWLPDDDLRRWAAARGFSALETETEAEKFYNHWTAKAGAGATKLDWPATFRNWMLNSRKFNGHGGSPPAQQDTGPSQRERNEAAKRYLEKHGIKHDGIG